MNKYLKAVIIFVLCFVALFLILKLTYKLPKEFENIRIFDKLGDSLDELENSSNTRFDGYDFTEALKVLEGMNKGND